MNGKKGKKFVEGKKQTNSDDLGTNVKFQVKNPIDAFDKHSAPFDPKKKSMGFDIHFIQKDWLEFDLVMADKNSKILL